jgi:hypothetical protein
MRKVYKIIGTLILAAMAQSCSTTPSKPPLNLFAVGSGYDRPDIVFVRPGEMIAGVPAWTNFWAISVPALEKMQKRDLLPGGVKDVK